MAESTKRPEEIRVSDLTVRRMGFGAMRLPGPMVWGEPADPEKAKRVLRHAVELGINFIDTAWYYGPWVSNRLIVEALHPYPKGLVIATKLGGKRLPDKSWAAAIRPEELRQGCEDDLRTLKLDRCDVVHLRWMPGAPVPFKEALGALLELQREGKIRHIGLSNVSREQLVEAAAVTPIATVQNLFSVVHQGEKRISGPGVHTEPESPDLVLDECEKRGIPFLPYFPLAMGKLGQAPSPAFEAAAKRHNASVAQIALAWLFRRSKVMLPIPGTSSVEHLEENWAAQFIELSKDELASLAKG